MAKGTIIRTYKMRGSELYNAHNRKIAIIRGESIHDASNRRVGEIRGDDLLDSEGRIMMTLRGPDIYDADNRKVAGLSEAQETIEGSTKGVLRAALWFCFVR